MLELKLNPILSGSEITSHGFSSDQHPTTAEVEAQNAEEENGEEEEAQQTAEIEEGDKDHSQHQHQPAPKSEALRNQFNFSERAAQTANNPFRVSFVNNLGAK